MGDRTANRSYTRRRVVSNRRSFERYRLYLKDGEFIDVCEFLQYRIARLHKSLVIQTPGDGGAGQRAAASHCRRHARPFSGTDSRAQPCHALDHA
eukprot:365207-Pleurochrysis_carterae.AAC.2